MWFVKGHVYSMMMLEGTVLILTRRKYFLHVMKYFLRKYQMPWSK